MPNPQYTSFKEYDKDRTSNIDFKKHIHDYTARNVNSRDFFVYALSREEFNQRQRDDTVPVGHDKYITRIVVFDEKYLNDLKFEQSDLTLELKITDISGFDKDEEREFNYHEVSAAIADSVISETDQRGADDIAMDMNDAKNKAMSHFLGNGDPTQAFNCFLDRKLKMQGIYAFDEKKVQAFINGINADLDKKMKPVVNENSDYNKKRRYLANNVGAYDKIVNILRDAYPDLGKMNAAELFTTAPSMAVPPTPETATRLLYHYLTLKDKVSGYTSDVIASEKTTYESEKNALPRLKEYLQNVCKIDADNVNKGNFEEEKAAYLDRVKEKSIYSHDLYNLDKTAKEYMSHGILWRTFLGGSLRTKMDRYQKELVKNGMNKDFVKAVRNNDYSDKTVERVRDSLQREIAEKAPLAGNALDSVNKALGKLAVEAEDYRAEFYAMKNTLNPSEPQAEEQNPAPEKVPNAPAEAQNAPNGPEFYQDLGEKTNPAPEKPAEQPKQQEIDKNAQTAEQNKEPEPIQ